MAGHVITLYLKEQGHEVTGLVRRPISFADHVLVDVKDSHKIREILEKGQYDAVINCIGILNREVDEYLDEGIYMNSFLPHQLARLTKDMKTKVIHLSTDCVFKGDKGGYTETSDQDAYSHYGKTKALGEVVDHKNLTIRTSIIGPDWNSNGIGLFNWFMLQEKEVKGFSKAIWTGVTTITLAKSIEILVQNEVTGLIHLVNNETINKYELLKLFNSIRRVPVNIQEEKSYCVDKSLMSTRTDLKVTVPSYEEMIEEMKEWIKKYKELYPQYKI